MQVRQKLGSGFSQWNQRPRHLGDACLVAEHCPPTMDCLDYACDCAPGHRPKNEWECEPVPKVHQKGKEKGHKSGTRTRPTEADSGEEKRPKCRPGEVLVDSECLPARLSIGTRCHRSAQCAWNGAHCVSGRCQCTGGSAAFRNRCHRKVSNFT